MFSTLCDDCGRQDCPECNGGLPTDAFLAMIQRHDWPIRVDCAALEVEHARPSWHALAEAIDKQIMASMKEGA